MRVLRLPFALGMGALFALGTFYLLWSFVNVQLDVGPLVEPRRIAFTPQVFDTQPESKRTPKVERRPPPEVVLPPQIGVARTGPTNVVHFGRPELVRPPRASTGMSSGIDRDVIPLVRFEPDYPPRAIARNVEGWVRMQFTIAANGSVVDPIVVAAEPPGIFDDAALAAIARWRYQPRIENGVPVERVGLQTVIRFELE